MGMISNGIALLNEKLAEHEAETLTIRNAAGASIAIPMVICGEKRPPLTVLGATPGTLDLQDANAANQVYSFSFEAAELNFGAGLVEPDDGMQILWPVGNTTYVCEIMPPNDGSKSWET